MSTVMQPPLRHDCPASRTAALRWAVRLLAKGNIDNPRLEAELLLAHLLKLRREQLYGEQDQSLSKADRDDLVRLLQRRLQGEPLAHITGRRAFYKNEFHITAEVLIPRPETEILVESTIEIFAELGSNRPAEVTEILEVGTGCGAIAISLLHAIPNANILAIDVSEAAVTVAKKNATRLLTQTAQRRLTIQQLDFDETDLGKRRFDLIVSNPPYCSAKDFMALPREVRDFEPRIAIDGGSDGLRFIEPLICKSRQLLRADGHLIMEVGAGQHEAVSRILKSQSFGRFFFRRDLASIKRCLIARNGE